MLFSSRRKNFPKGELAVRNAVFETMLRYFKRFGINCYIQDDVFFFQVPDGSITYYMRFGNYRDFN